MKRVSQEHHITIPEFAKASKAIPPFAMHECYHIISGLLEHWYKAAWHITTGSSTYLSYNDVFDSGIEKPIFSPKKLHALQPVTNTVCALPVYSNHNQPNLIFHPLK